MFYQFSNFSRWKIAEKFGTILLQKPDDVSQSTPDNCSVFKFLILKNCWADPSPRRYALASIGHFLPTVKFLGGNAP